MKKLTNMQIKDLQQILDDMHNDPSCENGMGEWLNYVVGVRYTINEAIDNRDGQIILDAFSDGNYQDFGAVSAVSPAIKPKVKRKNCKSFIKYANYTNLGRNIFKALVKENYIKN